MSKFLAPIHELMYNKIQYLDTIVYELSKTSPYLLQETDEKFGKIEKQPLVEVIDQENIHGWLQERVDKVEKRLAYVSSSLAKGGGKDFLLEQFFQAGLKQNFSGTANEAFSKMNQTFLDGMPCDHINQLIEQSPEKVTWIVTKDLHKPHYQFGVDGQIYDHMRMAWLRGLLAETKYEVQLVDNKYTIE